MANESSVCSIVVVGGMNPRLHHPTWYRNVGLINEDAEAVALSHEDKLLVCSSELSQFRTARYLINCTQGSWRITADDLDLLDEIKEIVVSTFDSILPHTPVSAVGFNFGFQRSVGVENIANLLASKVKAASLGLDNLDAKSATVSMSAEEANRTVNIRIEPSNLDSRMILVSTNFHYVAPKQIEGEAHWELASIVKGILNDKDRAEELCSTITSVISLGQENGS